MAAGRKRMEQDGRLSIIVLTSDKRRGIRVLESINRLERFNFTTKLVKAFGKLYTGDAIYRVISTEMPEKWQGNRADQVIVDMLGENYRIARQMLFSSCVPEEYQIIDDRDIL
jgi:hypothetical protein